MLLVDCNRWSNVNANRLPMLADRVLVIEKGEIVHESPRAGIDEARVAGFLSV